MTGASGTTISDADARLDSEDASGDAEACPDKVFNGAVDVATDRVEVAEVGRLTSVKEKCSSDLSDLKTFCGSFDNRRKVGEVAFFGSTPLTTALRDIRHSDLRIYFSKFESLIKQIFFHQSYPPPSVNGRGFPYLGVVRSDRTYRAVWELADGRAS
jgi:hypothetical protein